MRRWIVSLARSPRLSLSAFVALALVALAGIPRITFDGSLASLSVPDDPSVVFNEEVRRQFGDEEIGIVLLEHPELFSVDTITALRRLTDELAKVRGVSRTLSITNASDPVLDVFNPPPLLPVGPVTTATVQHLRERVRANPVYTPNLLARDERAAAVTVFFKSAVTTEDEAAVDRAVRKVLAGYTGSGRLYYTGMSHIRVQAVERMQNDLLGFLPASLMLMMFVLWLVFRSVRATVLPLVALALDVGCLVGLMGWFDQPITLATLVLPSLLLVIGGSYAIHVVDAYLDRVRTTAEEKHDPVSLFDRTLSAVSLPVLVSAITNAIGFGSLVIHPIPAIAALGKFAVLGTAIVTVGCLIGIPLAFLSMPGSKRTLHMRAKTAGDPSASRLDRLVMRIGAAVVDYRQLVLAGATVLTVVAAYGAWQVRVDTDFLKAFRADSPVRQDFQAINDKLAGPSPISVVVSSNAPGYFRDIAALRQVKDFQRFVEELPGVDESLSLVDYLDALDLGLQNSGGDIVVGDDGQVKEPEPAKSFWDAPAEQLPQIFQIVAASPRTFAGVVDADFQKVHITLRTSLTGSLETAQLIEEVRKYSSGMFPKGVDVRMTGTLVVMSEVSNRVLQGQVESTALAFAIIFILLAFMFLSLRVGVTAMIPNIIPNMVFFGVMGFGSIELNMATSIIAAVALGISVDDTVHYMARLNHVVKTSPTQRDALIQTLGQMGRPVIATTLTLAAGFLVMVTSNFVVISAFGWLTAMTMTVAMLTNLFLLPAILATVPVVSVWDLAYSRLGESPNLTIPLFHGLGRLGVRLVILLGQLRKFATGEYIVRNGDEGREMYLILAGDAEVRLDKGATIPLGRGGILGEMALLRKARRGADVVAATDVEVLVIDEDFLRRLRIRYPRLASKFFLNVARILSDRLEEANRRL
ncbi:MAG TPA: MMPL family transporter [Candidatus Limnocylindrales bacterium]|nr:MMPL family transporter [Candidatus Limnocylindrales bacterium]